MIRSHEELEAFKIAFKAAMEIFAMSKRFPREETYSLTDQIRRSSRSVSANIAEAWRKRRYEAAFISKLNDAESEAAETQVWIAFALECGYLQSPAASELHQAYDFVIGKLVLMIANPQPWILARRDVQKRRSGGAEVRRSRGAEERGSGGAEEQGSGGAEEQGSRGAEEQGSRGAEERRSRGVDDGKQ